VSQCGSQEKGEAESETKRAARSSGSKKVTAIVLISLLIMLVVTLIYGLAQ